MSDSQKNEPEPTESDDLLADFAAGENIFEEGDRGSHLYVIESGSVEIVKLSASRETQLARLEAGDFFGEMAVLEAMPRSATARALTDCRLLPIDAATFQRMAQDHPEITVRILRRLSGRLRVHAQQERRAREVAAGALAGVERRSAVMHAVDVSSRDSMSSIVEEPAAGKGSSGGPRLVHPATDSAIRLDGGDSWMLGRSSRSSQYTPDIDLLPYDIDRSLSRRHARIQHRNRRYFVCEDRHTANGTWLAGRHLVAGQVYEMRDGDLLKLGLVELVFRDGRGGG